MSGCLSQEAAPSPGLYAETVFPGWSGCLGRETEDLIPEFVFSVQKAFYVLVVSSDRQQHFGVVRPVAPKVQRVETCDSQDVLCLPIVIGGTERDFEVLL